jgi:2,4-dienoyl-CoA reductase-like NADH-dependent reductase (Old Yellow Enzyme family)
MLFEKSFIGNCEIKNRFVRSATFEGMATVDGLVTDELNGKMRELAEGEVGMIISGHAYVSPEGRAGNLQLAADRDECFEGLKSMAETVHKAGSKIFLQLAHAGAQAIIRETAMGPSVFAPSEKAALCREMTTEDISDMAEAFAAAALRAKDAGFDGVQIHSAHGYLLSQFLSPYYNKRTDQYGGTLENRSRFLLETFLLIRTKVGEKFPVIIKINSEDFLENGFTADECLEVCAMLENAGLDGVELSGGTLNTALELNPSRKGDIKAGQEVYYRQTAMKFKQKMKIPLLLVGGVRYYEQAESVINDGVADFISLCRPLIREPGLVKRWHTGDKRRATCISCNLCFHPALTGKGLYCVVEERLKKK